jgi:hypothetical protein
MNNEIGTQARRSVQTARFIREQDFNGFPVPHKSINASEMLETQEMSGHSGNSATFFGPMVAPHFKDMCLRVRNAPASGINATDCTETAIL